MKTKSQLLIWVDRMNQFIENKSLFHLLAENQKYLIKYIIKIKNLIIRLSLFFKFNPPWQNQDIAFWDRTLPSPLLFSSRIGPNSNQWKKNTDFDETLRKLMTFRTNFGQDFHRWHNLYIRRRLPRLSPRFLSCIRCVSLFTCDLQDVERKRYKKPTSGKNI